MIKSLSHISLTSNDLKKVEKFYIKILNFKIAHRFINQKKETYGLFIFCNKLKSSGSDLFSVEAIFHFVDFGSEPAVGHISPIIPLHLHLFLSELILEGSSYILY